MPAVILSPTRNCNAHGQRQGERGERERERQKDRDSDNESDRESGNTTTAAHSYTPGHKYRRWRFMRMCACIGTHMQYLVNCPACWQTREALGLRISEVPCPRPQRCPPCSRSQHRCSLGLSSVLSIIPGLAQDDMQLPGNKDDKEHEQLSENAG